MRWSSIAHSLITSNSPVIISMLQNIGTCHLFAIKYLWISGTMLPFTNGTSRHSSFMITPLPPSIWNPSRHGSRGSPLDMDPLQNFPMSSYPKSTPFFQIAKSQMGIFRDKELNQKIFPPKKNISKWKLFPCRKASWKNSPQKLCRAAAALASVKQVDSNVSTPQATSSSTWTRKGKMKEKCRAQENFNMNEGKWTWRKVDENGLLFKQSLAVWDLAACHAIWLVLGKWWDPSA